MGPMNSLRTRLRSLLGEQIPRGLPRRSRKPRIGAYVVHVEEGLRLVMQAGLSDELWIGLVSERSLKGDGSQTTWNAPTSREHTVVPSWSETADRKERAAYATLSFFVGTNSPGRLCR